MKKLLRRRRMKKNSASPFSVNEIQPINDNLYLAAASQAAVADKASGAYDEFLFNDDSLTNMPFEVAVDRHTDLLGLRLREGSKVELLDAARAESKAASRVEIQNSKLNDLQTELDEIDENIALEISVLDGQAQGDHGLLWAGSVPRYSGRRSFLIYLAGPILVFLFVALADLGIFAISLGKLLPHGGKEIFLFAIPAIGIQVGFPHLIGERISWILHDSKHRKTDLRELTLLAFAWISFCVALTSVRMNFVIGNSHDLKRSFLLRSFVALLTFLMILGLGALLVFMSARNNPHQVKYVKLRLRQAKLRKKYELTRANLVESNFELAMSERLVQAKIERHEELVEESGLRLSEATKAVYRRALVNSFGKTDFTSAYLLASESGSKPQSNKPVSDLKGGL